MSKLRNLVRSDVVFSFSVEQEDRRPDFQTGDPSYKEQDDKLEAEVMERLNQGDVWAWAYVKVTARWGDFSASDGLGGCSFKDEAEFTSDGHLAELENEALCILNDTLESVYHKLSLLVVC